MVVLVIVLNRRQSELGIGPLNYTATLVNDSVPFGPSFSAKHFSPLRDRAIAKRSGGSETSRSRMPACTAPVRRRTMRLQMGYYWQYWRNIVLMVVHFDPKKDPSLLIHIFVLIL